MAEAVKKKKGSVAPFYGVAVTWAAYALLFDLYTVWNFLFVALLSGIFSIMDMGITTVNCLGSVVVAAVVSASEEARAQKDQKKRGASPANA